MPVVKRNNGAKCEYLVEMKCSVNVPIKSWQDVPLQSLASCKHDARATHGYIVLIISHYFPWERERTADTVLVLHPNNGLKLRTKFHL